MPISLGCLHNAQRSLPRKSAGILRAGHATRRSCPKQCSTPEPRRRCYSSSDRWYRMFVDATALALAQRYRIHVRDRRAAPRKELRYLGFVAKNASSPLVPSTYLYIAWYPSCSWQGRHPPSPLSRPCPRLDSHICPGGGGSRTGRSLWSSPGTPHPPNSSQISPKPRYLDHSQTLSLRIDFHVYNSTLSTNTNAKLPPDTFPPAMSIKMLKGNSMSFAEILDEELVSTPSSNLSSPEKASILIFSQNSPLRLLPLPTS